MFHRHSLELNWELRDILDTMIPHAQLRTREFDPEPDHLRGPFPTKDPVRAVDAALALVTESTG